MQIDLQYVDDTVARFCLYGMTSAEGLVLVGVSLISVAVLLVPKVSRIMERVAALIAKAPTGRPDCVALVRWDVEHLFLGKIIGVLSVSWVRQAFQCRHRRSSAKVFVGDTAPAKNWLDRSTGLGVPPGQLFVPRAIDLSRGSQR